MIFDINPFDRYLKIGIFCQIYFTWFLLKKTKFLLSFFFSECFQCLKLVSKLLMNQIFEMLNNLRSLYNDYENIVIKWN